MEAVAVFKKRAGWFLITTLIILAGILVFNIVRSWQAVGDLCMPEIVGLTESEVIQHAKQPGLRYARLSENDAIIIADMTPEGPDCRIFFGDGRVKTVEYNGHGYSQNR